MSFFNCESNSDDSIVESEDKEQLDEAFNQPKNSSMASVWSFFIRENKAAVAKCIKCEKLIKCVGGTTTGMRQHLIRAHSINVDLKKVPKKNKGKS